MSVYAHLSTVGADARTRRSVSPIIEHEDDIDLDDAVLLGESGRCHYDIRAGVMCTSLHRAAFDCPCAHACDKLCPFKKSSRHDRNITVRLEQLCVTDYSCNVPSTTGTVWTST